jgi:putative ABC transport system permease protein
MNYVKTAIRNLLKNKVTSSINIIGLSIGMATALLILMWVNNELNFDRYHPQSDRIYRITCVTDNSGNSNKQIMEYSPLLLAEVAKNRLPEIKASGRLFTSNWSIPIVRVNDELYSEKKYATNCANIWPVKALVTEPISNADWRLLKS